MSVTVGAEMALSPSQRLLGITAAVASISAVGLALGLGLPLLSLVMEARGDSGWEIGLNTAMAGISSMAVTPFVTPLARRVGAARLLIVSIVATALSFPLFHLFPSLAAWFALRVVFHAGAAAAFVLSEFWINTFAPAARRGLVMGVYATVLSVGFGVGPIILSFTGTEGAAPFLVGAAILLVAVVPVVIARKVEPPLEGEPAGGFMRFVTLVPMATFAALVFGATESGLLSLLPVYGLRIGYDEQTAALLVTAVALGNVGLQIPIGLVADKVDRRRLLIGLAAICCALMMATPVLAADTVALFAGLLVFGGFFAGLYTVGLTHLGARLSGADLAAANAAFVFMYSLGMLGGPTIAGAGLDLWNPHGLVVCFGLFLGAYVLMGIGRVRRERRPESG